MRTVEQLAAEAIQIQDACNPLGLSKSYAKALEELRTLVPHYGTREIANHPINRLWASKLHDLAGMGISDTDRYHEAYTECERLAMSPETRAAELAAEAEFQAGSLPQMGGDDDERYEKDFEMFSKGYRCEISHPTIGQPLYFKSPDEVGPFLRQNFPNIKDVHTRMLVEPEDTHHDDKYGNPTEESYLDHLANEGPYGRIS